MCQFVKICALQQTFSCAEEILFFLLMSEENYVNRIDMVGTEPDAVRLYFCQYFLSLTFSYAVLYEIVYPAHSVYEGSMENMKNIFIFFQLYRD